MVRTRKQKIAVRTLFKMQIMLENSSKDVGHFQGLDPRRNGTEPMSANQTENGTRPLHEEYWERKGRFFITLEEEEEEVDDMQTLCREYTLPRDQETSRARGFVETRKSVQSWM